MAGSGARVSKPAFQFHLSCDINLQVGSPTSAKRNADESDHACKHSVHPETAPWIRLNQGVIWAGTGSIQQDW